MRADLVEVTDRVVPLGQSAHARVYNMWLVNLSPRGRMVNAPKSEKAREPPIMGKESRLEGGLKSFPLLLRLSRARFTSVDESVKTQSKL